MFKSVLIIRKQERFLKEILVINSLTEIDLRRYLGVKVKADVISLRIMANSQRDSRSNCYKND